MQEQCTLDLRDARTEAKAHVSALEAQIVAATSREQDMMVNMPPFQQSNSLPGASVGC